MSHLEKHIWFSCFLLALPFIPRTMAQTEYNSTEQINETEGYLQLNTSGLDVWSHTWNISVDEGEVIQLAVLKFTNSGDDMQTLNICNCTRLEIFDGSEINAEHLLYSSCNQHDPGYDLLTSTVNNLLVNVTSFGCSADNVFFKAFYKAVNESQVNRTCGGLLSEMEGNFTSPGFPSNYSDLLICEWVINADPLFRIQLWLDEIDIEMSQYNCEHDSIQVRDGDNRSSALLLHTCGNISPDNIGAMNSSGSSLYIKFVTNWNDTGRGFAARWTSVCQQTIPTWMTSGIIQSPSYLHYHQAALQCTYVLERKDSFDLELYISSFHLGFDNSNCLSTYIEIRSDPFEESTTTTSHRYCGSSIDRIFKFRNSSLWIRFATNGSDPYVEFQATFSRVIHSVHYAHLTGSEVSFAGYYSGGDYIWNITVEEGQVVQLAHYEYPYCSQNIITNYMSCKCHFLQVFDGFNIDMEKNILSACDQMNEVGLLTSSTNNMILIYTAVYYYYDDYHYHYFYDHVSIHYKSVNETSVNRTCGETLSGINGYLTSPGFPSNYDNLLICEWIIEVSDNFTILLHINEFDVAGSSYCAFDSLQIRDGDNASAPLLFFSCGGPWSFGPIRSSSNTLFIKFVSNWEDTRQGFRATWNMSCEQRIPAWTISGTIKSPSYLENHSGALQCTYIFERNDTHEVRLQFPTFNLGNEDTNCVWNYIEVISDSILESNLLGGRRYCGQNNDKQLIIRKSAFRILFTTDGSLSSAGFHATFERLPYEVNYVHLTGPEGNLILHFDGKDQVRNITADQGHVVQLAINYLYQNCTENIVTDYVLCKCGLFQVFDGFEIDKGNILLSACDTYTNEFGLLTSSTNNMVIVFTGIGNGLASCSFSGFYKSVDEKSVNRICGGPISSVNGFFSSPGFPSNYDNLLVCEWIISVSQEFTIRLQINEFDIQDSANCQFDSLQIRDGDRASAPLLWFGCNGVPLNNATFRSSSNALFVKFVSNWEGTGYGFKATWNILCEQTIPVWITPGTIQSPSYLQYNSAALKCTYVLERNDAFDMQLTVHTFNLYYNNTDCQAHYIEVRSGPLEESTLLGGRRFCGNVHSFVIRNSTVWIRFSTDGSLINVGFQATFFLFVRNVNYYHYTTSEGYLQSYFNGNDHVWNITAEEGQVLQLAIESLYFYCDVPTISNIYSFTCWLLQVFDGFDIDNGKAIFSASDTNNGIYGVLTSSTNNMVIVYTRIGELYGNYLSTFYMSVDGKRVNRACGGNLYGTEGSFTSPGFPNHYNNLLDCEWIITVDLGYTIRLRIEDLDIEPSSNCAHDLLQIRDGDNISAPLLLYTCTPLTCNCGHYISSNNTLFIKFVSNWNVTGRGFTASWSLLCQQTISAWTTQGIIQSPPYLQNHPGKVQCTYVLEKNDSYILQVTFYPLHIGNDDRGCLFNYVEIKDGPLESSTLWGGRRYCGNTNLPQFISTQSALWVNFVTNGSLTNTTFKAVFSRSLRDGYHHASQREGYLNISPSIALNFVWNISVDESNVVLLSVQNFYHSCYGNIIIDMASCSCSLIEVYDGFQIDSTKLLLRSCDMYWNSFGLLTSSTNNMVVVYTRQNEVNGSYDGFHYKSVNKTDVNRTCGKHFYSLEGNLTSPGFPSNYSNLLDCEWVITVDPIFRIRLLFKEIDLEGNSCAHDSLQVRDGDTMSSPLVFVSCGKGSNVTIISSNNTLLIKFISDWEISGRGFTASWTRT